MTQDENAKININFVMNQYRNKVNELTEENILLKAYIKQLEEAKQKELNGDETEEK